MFYYNKTYFFRWLLGGRDYDAPTQPKKTLGWAPPTLQHIPDGITLFCKFYKIM